MKRAGLFSGWCIENGRRRRARRAELAEAYRLISRHRDLWGKVAAKK